MVNDGQYNAAVASCEATARDHGHVVGAWYPVDGWLHASLCEECGDMMWVARSGNEKGCRIGGGALRQDYCLGEEMKADPATSYGDMESTSKYTPFLAQVYERFLELPIPIVLAVLWLAGTALIISSGLTLYYFWLSL